MELLRAIGEALLSSEVGKTPAAGVVVGVLLFLMKDWWDSNRAENRLRSALHTEVRTTWGVVKHLMQSFPTNAQVEAVVEGIRRRTLVFETVNELPNGFLFTAPTVPLGELVLRLPRDEAEATVKYFDVWARLVERERRYVSSFGKLLDLSPHILEDRYQLHLLEIADQVQGNLRSILTSARELGQARLELEALISPGKFDRSDVFTCPSDWDLG